MAWAALLRSPLCALSDGSLVALARRGLAGLVRVDPAEAAAALDAARGGAAPEGEGARLGRFLGAWRELRAARRRLDAGRARWSSPSGGSTSRRRCWPARTASGGAGNLRKALALARREAERGATPADLADRLRRMALRPPREPEADGGAADAVSLLTVHQAKGLEWPVVFVPELAARPPGRAAPAGPRRAGKGGRPALPRERRRRRGDRHDRAPPGARRAAAESAESRRLLYVALTRARDRIVLSGSGRAEQRPGSWAEVVGRAPPGACSLRRPAPDRAPPPAGAPEPERRARAPGRPACAPPRPPLPLRISVTGLAEYARCPRRHWFATRMRLPEPRRDEHGGDDPDRATVRGTLAHALLAEVDLAAPPLERRALLAAAAARRGDDPGRPGVRRIVEDVVRFLASPAGDRLAAAARGGALRRELPFLLRLEGAPRLLPRRRHRRADRERRTAVRGPRLQVRRPPRPGPRSATGVQLAAYALAASRAFPGRPVRAALHFLRGAPRGRRDARPRRTWPASPRRPRRWPLAAARGEGRDRSPGRAGARRGRAAAPRDAASWRAASAPPGPPAGVI